MTRVTRRVQRSKCSFLKDLLLKGVKRKSIKHPSNDQTKILPFVYFFYYPIQKIVISVYLIQNSLHLRYQKNKKNTLFNINSSSLHLFTSHFQFPILLDRNSCLSRRKKNQYIQVTGYKSREPSKPLFPKRKESRDCRFENPLGKPKCRPIRTIRRKQFCIRSSNLDATI